MADRLTRSTAHRLPPLNAWILALAYWRICKRQAEQLRLPMEKS